jgi:hypothetical protein
MGHRSPGVILHCGLRKKRKPVTTWRSFSVMLESVGYTPLQKGNTMKQRLALLVLALVICPIAVRAVPNPQQDRWKPVEEPVAKGLPRTAIERLEPIIAAALKAKAYPEAIKAIARKIALESNIQGNKPEEAILLLKAAIPKVPPEMHPVMEAILANWYWHYFVENNGRFVSRSRTAGSTGQDFSTWDLAHILAEIDRHFSKALANDKLLKSIPIAQYDDLLVKGTAPDRYRPTLYDFLAYNALAFYSSGWQVGARAQDAFELTADSPALAPAGEFLAWKLAADDRSPTVKALRLYQDLLRFHQTDRDRAAYLDADLFRLQFSSNRALGEEKGPRSREALKRFVEQAGKHEIAARALHAWATLLTEEGQYVAGRKLALRGVKEWPDSVGGRLCHNLIQAIEAKSARIETERVWNAPWPTINVRYCNLTRIHFRAIPASLEESLKGSLGGSGGWAVRESLPGRKPARAWSADLPATPDYQERTQKLPVPQDLKPGFYYLLASHDGNFGEKGNEVTYTTFWVSNLAIVPRIHHGKGTVEGLVTEANSGKPIAGVEVSLWSGDNEKKPTVEASAKSNADGLFRFDAVRSSHPVLVARHQGQVLASSAFTVQAPQPGKENLERTVLFTDRALYRPAQTIHYRGICIRADTEKDRYEVLPRHAVTVVLTDAYDQEVAQREHRTNGYGSFSGTFTAPVGRLTGRMHLQVKDGIDGWTSFNVEEYKRPKFEVSLAPPKIAPQLDGLVELQGKAIAYTGAPVDGAKVRYRVVRQVRYPAWSSWAQFAGLVTGGTGEIAHGTIVTGRDGSFQVQFVARPDRSVSAAEEPIFEYTVIADVTDTTGETRSGVAVVNVGYAALQASLTADEWQTKERVVKLTVRTTTLDGEPQQAAGAIKIHRLRQPEQVHRRKLDPPPGVGYAAEDEVDREPDLSNPSAWPLGEVVAERAFKTDAKGSAVLSVPLGAGAYRALLETRDRFGKKATAVLPLQVLDPSAKKLTLKVPHLLVAPRWTVEPGEEFTALWGSGYDRAQAFIEVEWRGKVLQRFWTDPGQTQVLIRQKVTEGMRGGFTLRVALVRENRAYLQAHRVEVPWSNKQLKVRWERFTSKLEPGEKVTWTAVVTGPDAKKAAAEMVATLYDESLDAYRPHSWPDGFHVFRQNWSRVYSHFANHRRWGYLFGIPEPDYRPMDWDYRCFPGDITTFGGTFGFYAPALALVNGRRGSITAPMAGLILGGTRRDSGKPFSPPSFGLDGGRGGTPDIMEQIKDTLLEPAGPITKLKDVAARKNLNETAFFFPHLLSDKDGEVRIQFTMPEALTRWKFLGFAHDKELRASLLEGSAVTSRELMVQPHPPRFLREGDIVEFTVKVTNKGDASQKGVVRLTLADAQSGTSVDAALGNTATDRPFDIPAQASRTFAWRLRVPDDMGFLTYKAVATTDKLSDGEEGYLPVLSRRVLVTESLPLPLRGKGESKFDFARLRQSGKSDTLKHKQVTVQVVSNPSWYAIMALPYLMEPPYECTEQTFNRLYANALARHIAINDPKIRTVFDRWKGTPALDSPLQKNQDLRAVMLEETPWVLHAQRESQARRNVGLLFDDNRLAHETTRALEQLAGAQLPDGSWPWFPGGRRNDYVTLYITTGFGRLRQLGGTTEMRPALRAIDRLDVWIDEIYQELKKYGRLKQHNLTPTIALYLHARSFFLEDKAIAKAHKPAVAYFLAQAKQHWLQLDERQSQGHMALALHRFGDKEAAKGIMRSLKERSVTRAELGMFWRDLELSWWWYRAPIETQALMIEAFDEVMNDQKAVEDCKVWLLKQKQTQAWKTTKATADAVYALLRRGDRRPLVSDALVKLTLGGQAIEPAQVEAGTGFYEKRYLGSEIKPSLGVITTKKTDDGVSWASIHWQYLEDMGKVAAYEGTPLKLDKQLFTRVFTKQGPVLQPVKGALKVGDELVVRLVLRTDRDMEYVHLKDERGSGTEPLNVLSRYRYQDGLIYYEATRDTAGHFFIDHLPKGTYVFEYAMRVVHRGAYHTGTAQIQCLYAPEFNSHSASVLLRVE